MGHSWKSLAFLYTKEQEKVKRTQSVWLGSTQFSIYSSIACLAKLTNNISLLLELNVWRKNGKLASIKSQWVTVTYCPSFASSSSKFSTGEPEYWGRSINPGISFSRYHCREWKTALVLDGFSNFLFLAKALSQVWRWGTCTILLSKSM